ncbi:polysaccharide biosynthesis tyrosine autokinase [Halotalea alkalilenta]|uniref:polysaccharide biosynthesis tyrosine autokinase n=1 Tax=Halotalea alkalilenta TaxID=376489 RepID=UPI000A7629A7|nr:polysaccharide biosynthesis tyrosine autokinase [Halotalea alkalilenta]
MKQEITSSQNGLTEAKNVNNDIDIGQLLGTLIDSKWLILSCAGIFFAIGLAYVTIVTPIYQADALVQVEQPGFFSNPMQDVSRMLGQEAPSNDTEIQILQSRLVLGQTVRQLGLDTIVEPHRFFLLGNFLTRNGFERPSFAESSVWANEFINIGEFIVDSAYFGEKFTIQKINNETYKLSLNDQLLGNGIIGEDEVFLDGQVRLRIAELHAGDKAKFDLTKISELSAINGLRNNYSVTAQGRESNVLKITVNDPDSQRAQQIAQYISQNYLQQNIQRSSAEAEQSLNFLQQQAPEVRAELTAAEDILNAYRTQQDSVDLSLETQSVLQRVVNLDSQLNELEFAEADISRRFTPSHPTYAALLQKKSQLLQERGNLNREINSLPETQQQILRMQRDVEVNQQVYVQLLNKIQETNIARASTVGNVRILDTAVSQPNAVAPKKLLILSAMLALGALLGIASAFIKRHLRKGVESPEQIEEIGLPVYSTIPLSEEQIKLTKRVRHKGSAVTNLVTSDLLAEKKPSDLSIEALRNLRTSLHYAMIEAKNNILMITGPSPGIGKSFVCSNLAGVCAQGDQKVLLIDADMRKGYIHHTFRLKSDIGLSSYLSKQTNLIDVIQNTSVQNLDVITRGSVPPNPSELLMQEKFSSMLVELEKVYDLIIIDTPPVLAVTDPMIIGKNVGTVLMVIRFQYNPIKEIEFAQKRLENAGVILKGTILNAIERNAAATYGYGYYNYSYK